MGTAGRIFKKMMIVTYIVMLHVIAVFYIGEKVVEQFFTFADRDVTELARPEPVGIPTPLPEPNLIEATPIPTPTPEATPTPPLDLPEGQLVIPVAGIKRSQLLDTFSDPRSDERTHDAIDIPAPAGTPVLAAADGELVRFHESVPGGVTIYQVSSDRKYVFYYAHLQSRVADLTERQKVTRGTVIGYVGDTGNAGPGNYHLHFSIGTLSDPDRYWESVNVNPYPLLMNAVEVPR